MTKSMSWRECASRKAKTLAARTWNAAGGLGKCGLGQAFILTYHRVLPERTADNPLVMPAITVWAEDFERQMGWLKRHFEVVGLGELVDLLGHGRLDPSSRYACVTFDDGWRDNFTHAWPALNMHRVPATIFLVTSLIGTNRHLWWEDITRLVLDGQKLATGPRLHLSQVLRDIGLAKAETTSILSRDVPMLVKRKAIGNLIQALKPRSDMELRAIAARLHESAYHSHPVEPTMLDEGQIRLMASSGVSFAPHTETHAILTRLGPAHLKQEIVRPLAVVRRILEGQPDRALPVFCYPNGDFDDRVVAEVMEAGLVAAVSTNFGHAGPGHNLYALPRINMHAHAGRSEHEFLFHLSGLLKRWKGLIPGMRLKPVTSCENLPTLGEQTWTTTSRIS